MLKKIFPARKTEKTVQPNDLWLKCSNCNSITFRGRVIEHYFTCPECKYHYNIPSMSKIIYYTDLNTFTPLASSTDKCIAGHASIYGVNINIVVCNALDARNTKTLTDLFDDAITNKNNVVIINPQYENYNTLFDAAFRLSMKGKGCITIFSGTLNECAFYSDIIFAEPTTRFKIDNKDIPAESLIHEGMIDNIVHRMDIKKTLLNCIQFFG